MMCTRLFVSLLGFVASGLGQEFNFEGHLSHLETERNPSSLTSDQNRFSARAYVKDQFTKFGLELHLHDFSAKYQSNAGEKEVDGQNIIGVLPGVGAADAPNSILLVGADYDSAPGRHPLKDNGVGVGVMLEAARVFAETTVVNGGMFKRIHKVLFVAFDLNTREYGQTSKSPSGSEVFVRQWLWKYLNNSSATFAGAIIIDSVSNVNMETLSQHLPNGFDKAFPESYNRIKNGENKGDFLAMFTRGNRASVDLAQVFSANYNKDRRGNLFRLENLTMSDGVSADVLHMIDHQAHTHFWTHEPQPLPALLLTDTEFYRKEVDGRVCPLPCNASTFLTREEKMFLTKTSLAILNTLLDVQTDRDIVPTSTPATDGAAGSLPSILSTTVISALAYLLW